MAIRGIIKDPSLLPVLQASADTLAQCEKLFSLLDPSSVSASTAQSEELKLVVSQQQKHLFALLGHLRGQHRAVIRRVRETKSSTAEARQEIDRLHLQLQNLYYEHKHILDDLVACDSYQ